MEAGNFLMKVQYEYYYYFARRSQAEFIVFVSRYYNTELFTYLGGTNISVSINLCCKFNKLRKTRNYIDQIAPFT